MRTMIAVSLTAVLLVGGGAGAWAYNTTQTNQRAQAVEHLQDLNFLNEQAAEQLEQTIEKGSLLLTIVGQDVADPGELVHLEEQIQNASKFLPFQESIPGDETVTNDAITVQKTLDLNLQGFRSNVDQAIEAVEGSHDSFVWNTEASDLVADIKLQLLQSDAALGESQQELGKAEAWALLEASTKQGRELSAETVTSLEGFDRLVFVYDVETWTTTPRP